MKGHRRKLGRVGLGDVGRHVGGIGVSLGHWVTALLLSACAMSGAAHTVPVPGGEEGLSSSLPAGQLPWQQIPRFEAGVTDVGDYSKKLSFIHSIWPDEHLCHLAPRAALLCDPISFKKITSIGGKRLKEKDGIKVLVEALGGQWGKLPNEDKYEKFERALYLTIQKPDESNDSYLARHDYGFEEMAAQGTTLSEVRAYILLRQSGLSHEEKKVIVDCGGSLEYDEVRKAIRLLGSRVFQELHGGSRAKVKTYDVNCSVGEEHDHIHLAQMDDVGDEDQMMNSLLEAGDEDAVFINEFEEQIIDALQETSELSSCFSAYTDARARLKERIRNRGFWSTSSSSSKSSFKGGGKGFRKGKGKGMKSLADRIANSTCRLCGRQGHWKRECPLNPQNKSDGKISPPDNANMAEDDQPQDEVVDETPVESVPWSSPMACSKTFFWIWLICMLLVGTGFRPWISAGDAACQVEHCFGILSADTRDELTSRLVACCRKFGIAVPSVSPGSSRNARQHSWQVVDQISVASMHGVGETSQEEFCDEAIIDTGASRTVIGEDRVPGLIESLKGVEVRRMPSTCVFRFGNNGTLHSRYALLFARTGKGWIRVEVVPGRTPFLLSNRLLMSLQVMVDPARLRLIFPSHEGTVGLRQVRKHLMSVRFGELLQMHSRSEQCMHAHVHDTVSTQSEHDARLEMHEIKPKGRIQSSSFGSDFDVGDVKTVTIDAVSNVPKLNQALTPSGDHGALYEPSPGDLLRGPFRRGGSRSGLEGDQGDDLQGSARSPELARVGNDRLCQRKVSGTEVLSGLPGPSVSEDDAAQGQSVLSRDEELSKLHLGSDSQADAGGGQESEPSPSRGIGKEDLQDDVPRERVAACVGSRDDEQHPGQGNASEEESGE